MDQIEIIKSIKLDANKWHIKLACWLMKFLWNINKSEHKWGCPFLWVSIANIIIFLPICIFKLIMILLRAIDVILEMSHEKWRLEYAIIIRNNHKERRKLAKILVKSNRLGKYWLFMDWLEIENIALYQDIIRIKEEVYIDIRNNAVIKQERRKQMYAWLIPLGKSIFLIILLACIAFLSYIIFHAASEIKFNWISFFIGLLKACVFAIAYIFIMYHIVSLSSKKGIGYYICRPFRWLGRGISSIYQFLTKKCPAIEIIN